MKYLRIALFLLVLPIKAEGQKEVMVQYQSLIQGDSTLSNRVTVQAYSYVSAKVGVWSSFWHESGYNSIAIGPFVDVKQWGENAVSIGVAAGAERFDGTTYARYSADLFVGNDDVYAELYAETGATHEEWYRVDANWQATQYLSIAIYGQTGDGIGPRLRLGLPKFPLRIWGAHMIGTGKFLVGADLTFQKK